MPGIDRALNYPTLSVVVCTRDRGDLLVPTITSLLANDHPNFEIIVVDQSSTDTTEKSLKQFDGDDRLLYVRTWTRGLGRARNIGMRHSRAPLVAMTDDDCTVPRDWVAKMESYLLAEPNIAVVYCEVRAAEYDRNAGFTPIFHCNGDRLIDSVQGACSGIGAGMAVRKDLVTDLGGFDEMLGAGSEFPSFEDADIAIRALLKGHLVLQTGDVSVEHFGFRDWESVRGLIRRDFMAIGAGHAKLIKCGQTPVLRACLQDCSRLILFPLLWHLVRLRKPPVLSRASSYFSGFAKGLFTPVDRSALVFAPKMDTRSENVETRYTAVRTLID